jgi:hypothetical protein
LQGKDSHSLQNASPFSFAQAEKLQSAQGPNLLSEPQPKHRTCSSGIPNLREIRLSRSGSSFVAIKTEQALHKSPQVAANSLM